MRCLADQYHGAEYVGENCEWQCNGNIAVTLGRMEMSTIYKGKNGFIQRHLYTIYISRQHSQPN